MSQEPFEDGYKPPEEPVNFDDDTVRFPLEVKPYADPGVRRAVAGAVLSGVALTLLVFVAGVILVGNALNITVSDTGGTLRFEVGAKGATTAENGQTPPVSPYEVTAGTQTDDIAEPGVVIVNPGMGIDGQSALSNQQIASKVTPSVVGILGENLRYGRSSTGSGIVMSEDGYIITNNHVVEGADKLTVVLSSGEKFAAAIVGLDEKSDLAVIKIGVRGLKPVEFGNSDSVVVGDAALAIGNPYSLELQGTVTLGIISAINRDIVVSEERVMTLIQTDASINPGNSGGPLVNEYGQVIGINTIKLGVSYFEGLGFAIPINTAKPILENLIEYGRVQGRPAIGITGWVVNTNQPGGSGGVYVESVDPRSNAYTMGIKPGDVITQVNGRQVTSMADLNKVKESMKVGDAIRLTVDREGDISEVGVVLMDENDLS